MAGDVKNSLCVFTPTFVEAMGFGGGAAKRRVFFAVCFPHVQNSQHVAGTIL